MKLTFYGGVEGLVTGANYLLDDGKCKILIDCGLSQGSRYAETMNYEPFDYYPKEIDYVLITHSHVDHMGRLPKLYKDGFRGKVYATFPTRDIIGVALPDTQRRIADDARNNNTESLYGEQEVAGVLSLIEGTDYDQPIDVCLGTTVIFHDAGHILGSAIVEVKYETEEGLKQIFFSGDLGNPPTPLLRPTEFVREADYLVVESAYGDRVHEDRGERKHKLTNIILETIKKGGTLMIPSFALERTQELLFELNEMVNNKSIPKVPVFVDSPLAIKITEVYEKYPKYFNDKSNHLINSGDDIFKFPLLRLTPTSEDSKKINDVKPPKIIIAGAGMSNGGRILHHERHYLSDPSSTILFVGYQVAGSLGRKIFDGASEVTIFGEKIPVNCRREAIGGYSAHADQPALLRWIGEADRGDKLKKVFVVQGELSASKSLAEKVKQTFEIEAVLPRKAEMFEI